MANTPCKPANRLHLLGLEKLCLQLLSFGDVLLHAYGERSCPLTPSNEGDIQLAPNHPSILSNKTFLDLVMIPFPCDELLIKIDIDGSILWMGELIENPVSKLFFTIPYHLPPRRIP